VDSGVIEGGEISIYYDPLISKLVTYGNTRDLAIKQMKRALDTYVIRGVQHNIPFCRDIMENSTYVSGGTSTKFIPEEYPDGFKGFQLKDNNILDLLSVAAAVDELINIVNFSVCLSEGDHSRERQLPNVNKKVVKLLGEKHIVEVTTDIENSTFIVHTSTKNRVVDLSQWDSNSLIIKCSIDNQIQILQMVKKTNLGFTLTYMGTNFDIDVISRREDLLSRHMIDREHIEQTTALVSPMAGLLVSVAVKVGDKVVKGQELAVVEAMKMQNVLRSERKGVVKSIKVAREICNLNWKRL